MAVVRAAKFLLHRNSFYHGINGCLGIRHHFNKDWKPGPYPRTKEERDAAAKKYGLLPEDYEPYTEDEAFGDYPKLPIVSGEERDPYENWSYPGYRRNFGEPFHADADIYGEDRVNPNIRPIYPYRTQVLMFLGTMAAFCSLFVFTEQYKIYPAVMPKHVYEEGVVHYTFEPDT